jgi:hypothetical protein
MRTKRILLPSFLLGLGAGCASPIALHTYQGEVLVYPDFLPTNQPTVLAFLDGNDRRCDKLVKPLRALASRKEVYLVGVLSYDDNSFLEQIATKREIVFPMMLDPRRKMIDRLGITRFPTYVYLTPQGKEIARAFEIEKVTPWYTPPWIHRAFGRNYRKNEADLARDLDG